MTLMLELTGQSWSHVEVLPDSEVRLHREVIPAFLRLQEDAAAVGIDLRAASAFRSYERQLQIWNAKAAGERPVLDDDGRPLEVSALSPWRQACALLRWSALPGASRHHWGTEADVYDGNQLEAGQEGPRLVAAEAEPGGQFADLHQWLDERLSKGDAHGFFRPYAKDHGGVGPEPWHLSHGPVARNYEQAMDAASLRAFLEEHPEIALQPVLLQHFDECFARFVRLPAPAHP